MVLMAKNWFLDHESTALYLVCYNTVLDKINSLDSFRSHPLQKSFCGRGRVKKIGMIRQESSSFILTIHQILVFDKRKTQLLCTENGKYRPQKKLDRVKSVILRAYGRLTFLRVQNHELHPSNLTDV